MSHPELSSLVGMVAIPARPGSALHCSTGTYTHAIVVSEHPFVMTSEDGTMRWDNLKREDFKVLCQVHPLILQTCLKRFHSGH